MKEFEKWLLKLGRRSDTATQYRREVEQLIAAVNSDDNEEVRTYIAALPPDVRSTLTTPGSAKKLRLTSSWNAYQEFLGKHRRRNAHRPKVRKPSVYGESRLWNHKNELMYLTLSEVRKMIREIAAESGFEQEGSEAEQVLRDLLAERGLPTPGINTSMWLGQVWKLRSSRDREVQSLARTVWSERTDLALFLQSSAIEDDDPRFLELGCRLTEQMIQAETTKAADMEVEDLEMERDYAVALDTCQRAVDVVRSFSRGEANARNVEDVAVDLSIIPVNLGGLEPTSYLCALYLTDCHSSRNYRVVWSEVLDKYETRVSLHPRLLSDMIRELFTLN